jgi:bacteriorhodopsin
MRGMSGLSWLLPVSSIGFFVFVGTAVALAITTNASAWLLAAMALPGIPFVWLGLMISLLDISRRPDDQISSDARMIWAAVLCILNVFAFIPYYFIVIRALPPIPEEPPKSSSTVRADAEDDVPASDESTGAR